MKKKMRKKKSNKVYQTNRSGDILFVKIFTRDGSLIYKGHADMTNPKQVESLISDLRNKGLSLPKNILE